MLGREVDGDSVEQPQDFINERLLLSRLLHYEMASALLSDLDKCVASHVLNTCAPSKYRAARKLLQQILTLVRLVHEFEEFINDRLQKLPMGLEETRVLSHDIHDIGRDHSLVVLATLNLAQAKEVLDDSNQEPLFRFLVFKRLSVCK